MGVSALFLGFVVYLALGRMYVSFNIPDIEVRNTGFPQFWLRTLFISGVSPVFEVNALSIMYVRLVGASMLEYSLGRRALLEFWGTHTAIALGAMHQSVSHFESCLSSAHRAKNTFSRLRRHAELGELSSILNNPKPNFTSGGFADKLRDIRNEIHHTEAALLSGKLGAGNPFTLKADGPETPHPTEPNQTNKVIDRLVIGSRELLFTEVAQALVEMADYCDKIASTVPSSRSNNAT